MLTKYNSEYYAKEELSNREKIKKELEEKVSKTIIFGNKDNPAYCEIYTFPNDSESDSIILSIKKDGSINELNHLPLNNSDVKIVKCKRINIQKKKDQSKNNLKIKSSTKLPNGKVLSSNDIITLRKNQEKVKVCILYVNGNTNPIVKIKSIYRYNKDLGKYKYGFNLDNLIENNLLYNSHLSKINIEEEGKDTLHDVQILSVSSIVNSLNFRNEYIEKNDQGLILKYRNYDTKISMELDKKLRQNVFFKDVQITNFRKGDFVKDVWENLNGRRIEKLSYEKSGYTIIRITETPIKIQKFEILLYKNKLLKVDYFGPNQSFIKVFDLENFDFDEILKLDLIGVYKLFSTKNCITCSSENLVSPHIYLSVFTCLKDNIRTVPPFGNKGFIQKFRVHGEDVKLCGYSDANCRVGDFSNQDWKFFRMSPYFELNKDEIYYRDCYGIPVCDFDYLLKKVGVL